MNENMEKQIGGLFLIIIIVNHCTVFVFLIHRKMGNFVFLKRDGVKKVLQSVKYIIHFHAI